MQSQAGSSKRDLFNSLPVELRLMVYSYLIGDFKNDHAVVSYVHKKDFGWKVDKRHGQPSLVFLALTCTSIHAEALPRAPSIRLVIPNPSAFVSCLASLPKPYTLSRLPVERLSLSFCKDRGEAGPACNINSALGTMLQSINWGAGLSSLKISIGREWESEEEFLDGLDMIFANWVLIQCPVHVRIQSRATSDAAKNLIWYLQDAEQRRMRAIRGNLPMPPRLWAAYLVLKDEIQEEKELAQAVEELEDAHEVSTERDGAVAEALREATSDPTARADVLAQVPNRNVGSALGPALPHERWLTK